MPVYNLNWYITQTQRLVHDVSGNYFTQPQLTDYVNQARTKTAQDSNSVRLLQSFALTPAVELYPFAALPSGSVTINVLGINVINGGFRDPIRRKSWSWMSAFTRSWVGYQQQPAVFAIYGENAVYMGPTPDIAYACEFDTAITPNDLIDNTSVEQLPAPWSSPVPYYAACLCKQYQQMWGEAEMFEDKYRRKLVEVRVATNMRVIGDIYTARQ